jgi:hypothetical protein
VFFFVTLFLAMERVDVNNAATTTLKNELNLLGFAFFALVFLNIFFQRQQEHARANNGASGLGVRAGHVSSRDTNSCGRKRGTGSDERAHQNRA